MRINNNIMAQNTFRQYSVNNENVRGSTEKLSSGFRINRAGDDAAGLAISEKMRAQIRGLNMASKNSQDAISLIQTAEAALTETHAILQRMSELATQSASDTNQDDVDREALDAEFQQLKAEITDIATKTTFNKMNLLDGSFGVKVNAAASNVDEVTGVAFMAASGAAGTVYTFSTTGAGNPLTVSDGTKIVQVAAVTSSLDGARTIEVAEFDITIVTGAGFTATSLNNAQITMDATGEGIIQTGANAVDTMSITIDDMSAAGLNVDGNNILTREAASTAMTAVNDAINAVSTQRAALGAYQNRLQHKINNLDTASENLQAAESRIRDLDMAKEMTVFTKNTILVQASTAMLAQANSAPQGVLQLLK